MTSIRQTSRLLQTTVIAIGLSAGAAFADKDGVVIGMGLEPPHLNPAAGAAAAIDEVVYANIYEGLTRMNRNAEIVPGLAERWEISDDGLTYTFHLRKGVTFHDGATFECADVEANFARAMSEDSVNAQKGLFEPIESVSCSDAHTAVLTLKRPTGAMQFNLSWGDAVILDSDADGDALKTQPNGTGPFKFDRWVKGDRIEISRFDGYWGEQPALASATFRIVTDATAAFSALQSGDIDAFPNMPGPEFLPALESDPNIAVVTGSTEGETILAINNARPPWDNVTARRALAHAIDRKAIIDGAMFGLGTPIGSHVAPHSPAYVDLTGTYPYDPERARAMLAEAGVPDGQKVVLRLPPPGYARNGGEIVAAQLRDVGLDVEIVPVEWAQWLEQVFKQTDYDLTIVSHTEPADIEIYARDEYYFNYDNPDFKALYKEYAEASDPDKAAALLGGLQRKLSEDSVNVFLFQLAKNGVWNAKLKGMWENSPVQANDLTEVRWED